MKFIRTKINGDDWNFYLCKKADISSFTDDGGTASAVTDSNEREIYISEEDLSIYILRHEYKHACDNYLFLSDCTGLSVTDMEEIQCNLFAWRGEQMIEQSRRIYDALVALKNSNDEDATVE